MTLNEAAQRLGVETLRDTTHFMGAVVVSVERPTLDIAHEVLAKLPRKAPNSGWLLHYDKDGFWRCVWDGPIIVASFEECVTALAERYLATQKEL